MPPTVRRTPRSTGGVADLARFPVVRKDELRQAQATAPPFSDYLCIEPSEVALATLMRARLRAHFGVHPKIGAGVGGRDSAHGVQGTTGDRRPGTARSVPCRTPRARLRRRPQPVPRAPVCRRLIGSLPQLGRRSRAGEGRRDPRVESAVDQGRAAGDEQEAVPKLAKLFLRNPTQPVRLPPAPPKTAA